MAIEFRCSNIVSYDAARDRYELCDQLLTAPTDQVAKFVICPKCHSRALVPPAPETGIRDESEDTRQKAPQAATESRLATPLPYSSFDAKQRCRRCGGALDQRYRCQVCGYQSVLTAKLRVPDQSQIQPAGCQRWLSQKLAHGIGISSLLMATHSFVAILSVMLCAAAISSGGAGAIAALLMVATFVAAYLYAVLEFRRIARKPPATLNWWQRASWNVVLAYYRARGWRTTDRKLHWLVLDLRNQPCDDAQITARHDLTKYHVLDLEGTGLTDAGLLKLQGLGGLQRLVVRKTNTTQEAVFVVQQQLPRAWIWN